MPFQSKRQSAACFARRGRGAAKGWDCAEWARKTDYAKLPKRVQKAGADLIAGNQTHDHIELLAARAASLTPTPR